MQTVIVKKATDLVQEARQNLENLSSDQVQHELEKTEVLLVDLRESEELKQQGRISGSIHAPRGMLEFYADPSSPYFMKPFESPKRIILYCASGGRSALGAVALKNMGYTNIAHLSGGFKGWKEAGMPVEQ